VASTYSPYLQIQLIASGDQSGTWGTTTNTNLGTVIEQAIAGNAQVNVVTAAQAFTVVNGASDQARCASITLTTSTSANFAVYAPPTPKIYTIFNNTSYIATIYNSTVQGNTTPAGTGINMPAGSSVAVWSDGTNFYLQNNDISTMSRGILQPSQGGTGTATSTGSGNNVLSISPTLTGTPLAPTAAPGTNTTQIATTAFVAAATGSLGTMASQNSNNVSITGGSINGTPIGGSSTSTGAFTTLNGTTITASTQFSGPGTGLTGTAASLNIGGNAATVTNGITTTNYNSYSPTLTGTGASGTWSISVTGTSDHITNSAYNGYGARTVSTSSPSGGSNGDIWYQV
jgi:hypothetical protein